MEIILKPIITEKATNDSELKNCFTFHVEKNVNKVQIKNTIESFYGVKVKKVRTINVRSNSKIRYTKSGIQYGKTNATKRAVVQVAEGDQIDFYSNL